MTQPNLYMVFDVESVGLHGEGFSVGWVVVDEFGAVLKDDEVNDDSAFDQPAEYLGYCFPESVRGTPKGREWVEKNWKPVSQPLDDFKLLPCPFDLRAEFWEAWQYWRGKGATLAADVPWPVEARFLSDCVADRPEEREWQGPYPLIDIASVRLAAGLDPLANEERRPDELPIHDALADARQSARLLAEALASLNITGRK